MKYKIQDIELSSEVIVDAPGFIEAIAEYLPWPTLQLKCHYSPCVGRMRVVDKQTGFLYLVELQSSE